MNITELNYVPSKNNKQSNHNYKSSNKLSVFNPNLLKNKETNSNSNKIIKKTKKQYNNSNN